MIHPIKSFRSFVEAIKIAFRQLIATAKELTQALEVNTRTIEVNSAKVDALAAEQKELRTHVFTLTEHSGYLATAKKRELQRAGHHS